MPRRAPFDYDVSNRSHPLRGARMHMNSDAGSTLHRLRWTPHPGAAFIGIDGARNGWVVATRSHEALTLAMYPTISDVPIPSPSRVLIDMPIGLPSFERRSCDLQARQLLGSRRSTIFPTPARQAVYASSYAECCQINLRHQGCKVSKQAWNLSPKIRELDHFIRADRFRHNYIAEAHPELAFRALSNSSFEIPSKRTEEGLRIRHEILSALDARVGHVIEILLREHRKGVDLTDAYDALALCMTLARAQGGVRFVGDGCVDEYGAPQRICVG
jgi:predicted RNase H-like nuclease